MGFKNSILLVNFDTVETPLESIDREDLDHHIMGVMFAQQYTLKKGALAT